MPNRPVHSARMSGASSQPAVNAAAHGKTSPASLPVVGKFPPPPPCVRVAGT